MEPFSYRLIVSILIAAPMTLLGLVLLLASRHLEIAPMAGFRTPYSVSSKKTWRTVNRFLAVVLFSGSFLAMVVSYYSDLVYGAMVILYTITVSIILGFEASRRMLELDLISIDAGEERLEPLPRPSKMLESITEISLVVNLTGLVIMTTLWVAGRVNVETSFILFPAALLTIQAYITYLIKRRPEALALPWSGVVNTTTSLPLSAVVLGVVGFFLWILLIL